MKETIMNMEGGEIAVLVFASFAAFVAGCVITKVIGWLRSLGKPRERNISKLKLDTLVAKVENGEVKIPKGVQYIFEQIGAEVLAFTDIEGVEECEDLHDATTDLYDKLAVLAGEKRYSHFEAVT